MGVRARVTKCFCKRRTVSDKLRCFQLFALIGNNTKLSNVGVFVSHQAKERRRARQLKEHCDLYCVVAKKSNFGRKKKSAATADKTNVIMCTRGMQTCKGVDAKGDYLKSNTKLKSSCVGSTLVGGGLRTRCPLAIGIVSALVNVFAPFRLCNLAVNLAHDD